MAGNRKMTRRDVLKIGTMATALSMTGNNSKATPKNGRPNILFLMADQHRGDCLGCDGHLAVKTPNLDRLASEGVRFRHAYSSTPTCTPARAAILTGLSPWNHGVLGTGKVAEKYPLELPNALRDAGYHTMGVGKMHWHPQRNRHGFHQVLLDESGRELSPEFRSDYRSWFYCQAPTLNPDTTGIGWNDYRSKSYALPEHLHPTTWTATSAIRFLDNYDQEAPFFLKVSFARPHSPYDPPERWMKAYKDANIPPPVVGDWALKYADRSDDSFNIWHGDLGGAQARESRQGYYGSVSFVDESIGLILKAVEEKGLLENTLILYTSDHGDMTGDHHLWRKSYPYEASARIPMIVRWPDSLLRAERGITRDEVVELRDILPTFLAAASFQTDLPFDGRSLLDLIDGESTDWRKYIDLEHNICYSDTNHWNALTNGFEKYIFNAYDGSEQFFDLQSDPHECANLIDSAAHSSQVSMWRERMVDHLQPRGDQFVVDRKLMKRPQSLLYSPQYPGKDKSL